MKKFLALLLTLVLMFSCSTAMADNIVQPLSSHIWLNIISSFDDFSIKNLESDSHLRTALVVCALMDFSANSIINEIPASIDAEMICVGIINDTYSVFIPLENQTLVSFSTVGSDSHGYAYFDSSFANKSIMKLFMDSNIEDGTYDNYWFVSSEDIYSFANHLANGLNQ